MKSNSVGKAEPFVQSCVKGDALRFTLRIDKFSKFEGPGVFTSPTFQSEASGNGWSLIVSIDDSYPSNFMLFQLVRQRFRKKVQFVGVKLSVASCFGEFLHSGVKRLQFVGLEKEAYPVACTTKDQISGCWGLKCLPFLPNDALTLRCEITECAFETDETLKKGVESSAHDLRWRDLFVLSVPATGFPLA